MTLIALHPAEARCPELSEVRAAWCRARPRFRVSPIVNRLSRQAAFPNVYIADMARNGPSEDPGTPWFHLTGAPSLAGLHLVQEGADIAVSAHTAGGDFGACLDWCS